MFCEWETTGCQWKRQPVFLPAAGERVFHVRRCPARACRCESQASGHLWQRRLEKGSPRQPSIQSFSGRYQASPPLLGGSPALSFLPCTEQSHNVDGNGVAAPILSFKLFVAFWGNFDVSMGMGVGFSVWNVGGFLEKFPIPLKQSQGCSKFGEKCRVVNGCKEGVQHWVQGCDLSQWIGLSETGNLGWHALYSPKDLLIPKDDWGE